MSPDGTKVYAVNHNGSGEGFTNDAVTQYNLSTAWDLSTMSGAIGATISLNAFPTFQDSSPQAPFFSPDGLNLYVSSQTNRIFRFTLSTAYVVSTSTTDSSMATGLTGVSGLSFSQDGTKMFVNSTSNVLRRFTLSTAWDLSTATIDAQTLSIAGGSIHFATDGLSLYTQGTGLVKYYLATAWDLSSFQVSKTSVALSSLTGVTSGGIYLSPDESKFFLSGYTAYPVKRFDLLTPTKVH
jgi:DNA-binding beta-propeller fold protein YncE